MGLHQTERSDPHSAFWVTPGILRRMLRWMVSACLVFISAAAIAGEPVGLLYNERPPYVISTPEGIIGYTGGVVAQAFAQLDIPHYWRRVPSNRQLLEVRNNLRPVCAIGWFRNAERAAFGQFSAALYEDQPEVALSLASNARIQPGKTVRELMSAPGVTLLVKGGYSYGTYIDRQIREHPDHVVSTTGENREMLHMLEYGRVDFFFVAPDEVHGLIELSGQPASHFKLVQFADMPPPNRRYLFCSFKVPVEVMAKLNRWIENHVRLSSTVSTVR